MVSPRRETPRQGKGSAFDVPRRGRGLPLAAAKPEGARTWCMGAFDFETLGLHGRVLYGTLQWELEPDGERSQVLGFTTPNGSRREPGPAKGETDAADLVLAAMLEANRPGMRWYAHNAEYDLIYLIDAARRLQAAGRIGDIEPVMRGDTAIFRVIFHVVDGPPLECFDSMALAANGGQGISLAKFMAGFSTVGAKRKDVDFAGGELFDPRKRSHREYAKQDTRGLLDCMVNFDRAVHAHYGVHVKGTISATALKAWRVTLPPGARFWRLDADKEAAAREAYFGGLAFLTSTRKHRDVVSLDINSAYPHCMRTFGVPAGEIRVATRYERDIADGGWRPAPGIYLAEFEAPDDAPRRGAGPLSFGCVPYRDDTGMCFPRGRFVGWAWSIEVARAIRWGYRVKVERGYLWERIEYPFGPLVDYCEAKRAEHRGQPVEMIFKTLQNALYGKYGTKPDGLELLVLPPHDDNFREAADRNHALAREGWEMPMAGTVAGRRLYFRQREIERDAAYMMPHWSGWITAQTRGLLFDAIEAVRELGGEVICGDTDSLKIERRWVEALQASGAVSIGTAYGQWKIDAEYKMFRAYAPKCYSFLEWGPGPRRGGGAYKGKAKGIPGGRQTGRFHMRAFRGQSPRVRWKSSPNLLAILKGRPNALVGRSRVASVLENSDSWIADRDGSVRAVEIRAGERVRGKPID